MIDKLTCILPNTFCSIVNTCYIYGFYRMTVTDYCWVGVGRSLSIMENTTIFTSTIFLQIIITNCEHI